MLCFHPPLELEHRVLQYGSGLTASSADPQRPTWKDDTFNHQQRAIPDDRLQAQGLPYRQDEVHRPHRPIGTPESLSLPYHDNHKSFASLQSQTRPPIKEGFSVSAPDNVVQQVQPGLKPTLPPAASSGFSDQRGSCAVDITNLLNPSNDEDPAKSGRVPMSVPATTAVVAGLTKPHVPTSSSPKWSLPHHRNLNAPYEQEQNCECHDIDATPPEPTSADDSTSRYCCSPKQTNRNAPSMDFTGQPQLSLTNPIPSSGHESAFFQASFDSNAFSGPTSSPTLQSQYQTMRLERSDTAQGAIQVLVDVQSASKYMDEKRKRNAVSSHNFRQRRKEKERETRENISRLEADIREMAEERDHYRKERDYFQNVAIYNRIPIEPRPLSPRRRHYAWPDATPVAVSSA